MERIKLNLIPSGVAPVVHVSQYDDGRTFAIDLFEGDNAYTLDGTEVLTVNVRKPDGHLVTESVTNTSDSYVTVDTTEQMTACHGTNLANLKIEKGSITIASLNFLMNVERDPLENGDPSESFVDNLNTQIANAVADQYDSNNVIFDNAPTTGHGTPYTVTSEGIKTTFDNLTVGDLADVTITTPTQGEALVFDNDGNLVNGTVSTVGSIDDLSDVDTTGKGNDYSLVYNSNASEWQAKKLTVEVTQAEYDQLKLDGDLIEGVHYVITDGQDVTCNLGDLNDVDTTGASTGDILVKGASGWEKGNHVKEWTYLGSFSLSGNNTGTWTLNNTMLNSMDIVFFVGFGSGAVAFQARQSLNIPYTHFKNYGAFFEFGIVGTGRQYVELSRLSDTQITVANTSVETTVTLYAYCR